VKWGDMVDGLPSEVEVIALFVDVRGQALDGSRFA
jgi:hypothetical protein